MNQKKTILHIIQNFGRGGAETAVVGVLKNLHEYRNVVVTLDPLNQFGDELTYDAFYCLNLKSYYLFPTVIGTLKKIIRKEKVDIVHSQLYWSTVLARFSVPKHIPLVTSIQASLTNSVEYKKGWICQLDKMSYRFRKSTILGVSEHTLMDYFSFLRLQPHETHVLYNFVDTGKFNREPIPVMRKPGEPFRLVSVGNLKPQKNQQFMLDAFRLLKDIPVSLDIYGDGQLQETFERFIQTHNLPVRLMGKVNNLPERLPGYDLFLMSSWYEGFSLAVLEGMAMGKPMLLSDIPTFTEQADSTAEYFSLSNPETLAEKIRFLYQHPERLQEMSGTGRERVMRLYTLQHHLQALREIYARELSGR